MKIDIASNLQDIVKPFAGLTEADVSVSLPFWRKREIPKGNFYNKQNKNGNNMLRFDECCFNHSDHLCDIKK